MMTQPQDNNDFNINDCIASALSGDQTSFARIYDQYASGAYRLCYSLLFNEQDAEDVAQEAFVYAFKNLARYDVQKASFKTWLYTIAVSRCRNMYRRKRLPSIDLFRILSLNIAAPKSETPEAEFTRRDIGDAVSHALCKLSPRLREAVVLRYGHGLTYREIAEIMDCPQKTAESRVRLAHDKLRGVLQPVGPELLEELLSIG